MTKIEFAPSYSDSSSEFMLLSVDESVVDDFQKGQSLTIRGETTDHAVLCTDTTTYPIKIIESATTVLLMHEILEVPVSPTVPNFEVKLVAGKCYATGELCPAVDVLNIGRLKDMLREQELKWDWKDREEEEKCKGYRLEELMDVVQMSVGELKTALEDLPVIKFPNGKYRYLSHKFRGEMLGLIVEMLDEEEITDVTLEAVSFRDFITVLQHLKSRLRPLVCVIIFPPTCLMKRSIGSSAPVVRTPPMPTSSSNGVWSVTSPSSFSTAPRRCLFSNLKSFSPKSYPTESKSTTPSSMASPTSPMLRLAN